MTNDLSERGGETERFGGERWSERKYLLPQINIDTTEPSTHVLPISPDQSRVYLIISGVKKSCRVDKTLSSVMEICLKTQTYQKSGRDNIVQRPMVRDDLIVWTGVQSAYGRLNPSWGGKQKSDTSDGEFGVESRAQTLRAEGNIGKHNLNVPVLYFGVQWFEPRSYFLEDIKPLKCIIPELYFRNYALNS